MNGRYVLKPQCFKTCAGDTPRPKLECMKWLNGDGAAHMHGRGCLQDRRQRCSMQASDEATQHAAWQCHAIAECDRGMAHQARSTNGLLLAPTPPCLLRSCFARCCGAVSVCSRCKASTSATADAFARTGSGSNGIGLNTATPLASRCSIAFSEASAA